MATGERLSSKHLAFVTEYMKDFNGTQAAIRAGYSERSACSTASEILTNPNVLAEIQRRVNERAMGANETLLGITEIARGNIATFFKLAEAWTFYPLPTDEILDEKEITDDSDPDHPKTRISYLVRKVVIDLDKVIDPNYASIIQEFSDSPRDGIGLKLYSKADAHKTLTKIHQMVKDRIDITTGDEKLGGGVSDERFDRAISTLANAIRESVSGEVSKPESPVDTSE